MAERVTSFAEDVGLGTSAEIAAYVDAALVEEDPVRVAHTLETIGSAHGLDGLAARDRPSFEIVRRSLEGLGVRLRAQVA